MYPNSWYRYDARVAASRMSRIGKRLAKCASILRAMHVFSKSGIGGFELEADTLVDVEADVKRCKAAVAWLEDYMLWLQTDRGTAPPVEPDNMWLI